MHFVLEGPVLVNAVTFVGLKPSLVSDAHSSVYASFLRRALARFIDLCVMLAPRISFGRATGRYFPVG